jgi:hypothetical protein
MDGGYFPAFLYLSLGCWLLLLLVFIGFAIYLWRQPDEKILEYRAAAIENKRRLGIKVYRF